MDNWSDYSIDQFMATVSEPQDWSMNDAEFSEYLSEFPEEMFGGSKPVKMNFKDLFRLKLVKEKAIKKFGIN